MAKGGAVHIVFVAPRRIKMLVARLLIIQLSTLHGL
ncbi:Uncharacterised protein [Vibrio cholerae]|nr:Uncharacterised protein [Vibrio cholerae]